MTTASDFSQILLSILFIFIVDFPVHQLSNEWTHFSNGIPFLGENSRIVLTSTKKLTNGQFLA